MYLGIDIGTSGVKTVLVDDAQTVVDQAIAPLHVQRPKPLWSEQNPSDWWAATQAAVLSLDPALRGAVRAIGLSGQMHGATLLAESGAVLLPAILWNDGRATEACRKMEQGCPQLHSITGNLAMPGFTAPKLHWVRDQEPDIFSQVAKVLLPKDYIRFCMSGDYASDMSDSAGTLWMDVGGRDWSDTVLAFTGLDRSHMPALHEGTDVTGTLSRKLAAEWGMKEVPIAAGAGDNAAGAVGSGIVAPGDGFLSLGTSGVVFVADDCFSPNITGAVHTFCHAVPNVWHRMSVILSAASAVDFVASVTGFGSPEALFSATDAAATPSQGALFLPYLSGERTPHNDARAKGAFFGLTHNDTPLSLAQAALEGVAFALADGLEQLGRDGTFEHGLSVIGGGARSAWWGRVIASAMQRPLIYRSGATVGPAFGAARLARLCLDEDAVNDLCKPPPIDHTIDPDPGLASLYADRRQTFAALYNSTKGLTS